MDYARYLVPGTANAWDRVEAHQYDAAVHGTDLKCGHPLCEAHVIFRNCDAVAGGASRHSHFASLDRNEHVENCPCLTQAYEQDSLSVTLQEALASQFPILFNMNFQMGDPRFKQWSSSRAFNEVKSRYNRFRQDHKGRYARESIRSLSDYFSRVAAIQKRNPEGTSPILIGHSHDIRRNMHFAINDNKDLLRVLYDRMSAVALKDHYDRVVLEFPRLLIAQPVKAEFKKRPFNRRDNVECSDALILSPPHHRNVLRVVNTMQFANGDLREQFMSHSRHHVVALPSVSSAEIRSANHLFEEGQNGKIRMFWNIDSEDQFMPTADATETPSAPPHQQRLIA